MNFKCGSFASDIITVFESILYSLQQVNFSRMWNTNPLIFSALSGITAYGHL